MVSWFRAATRPPGIVPVQFEWDPAKSASNIEKHAITFEEASTIFGDTLSTTIVDPDISAAELRFVTLGRSSSGKLLVVVHVDRSNATRIVSARRATKQEQKRYEEQN